MHGWVLQGKGKIEAKGDSWSKPGVMRGAGQSPQSTSLSIGCCISEGWPRRTVSQLVPITVGMEESPNLRSCDQLCRSWRQGGKRMPQWEGGLARGLRMVTGERGQPTGWLILGGAS